jgi:hypothetical protein
LALVAAVSLVFVLLSSADSLGRGSRRKATFLGNFVVGVAYGPICLISVLLKTSHKARAAVMSGGMLTCKLLLIEYGV